MNKITIRDLETKLWKAADELRGNLSAEDYMHVLLGILTIKFINDKYELVVKKLITDGYKETDIDKIDLSSRGAFFVPKESKWKTIIDSVGTMKIGEVLDNAVYQLGESNIELKGIFNASYNDSSIDKARLGEVIKIFQTDNFALHGEDILGRIYEYFLGHFFLKRGQKGGEFYTPRSIVRLITKFLKPKKGKIYDPCCGTAGMLIQAKQYIEDHGGKIVDFTVYGQEFNNTTWKLAKLNLLLNGIPIFNINDKNEEEGALGNEASNTFTNDQHKDKIFDYIMANPPFNLKKWFTESLASDPRWFYGKPSENNANMAWIQHILYKLSSNGKAGVVLSNGSLTSSAEYKIREKIIRDNKVSCVVSLPDKLFYTTGISSCIWFFDNNKKTNDILMIDARNLGELIDGSKKSKEISDKNLETLSNLFSKFENGEIIDEPGLSKSVTLNDVEKGNFSLLPSKYITVFEKDKKSSEEIKKELKSDINQLLSLIDESKDLEKSLLEAIKKLNI
ncbi:MAG: N-6 DNA methylase [Mycoplasmoidaceae bacterium]